MGPARMNAVIQKHLATSTIFLSVTQLITKGRNAKSTGISPFVLDEVEAPAESPSLGYLSESH